MSDHPLPLAHLAQNVGRLRSLSTPAVAPPRWRGGRGRVPGSKAIPKRLTPPPRPPRISSWPAQRPKWRNGRRRGLKILRRQRRAGSTPAFGSNKINELERLSQAPYRLHLTFCHNFATMELWLRHEARRRNQTRPRNETTSGGTVEAGRHRYASRGSPPGRRASRGRATPRTGSRRP